MIYLKKQVVNNVIQGLACGYPPCCIEYFNIRQVNGEFFSQRERKLTGTGYICCNNCNELYSEEELVSKINSNRLLPDSFDIDAEIDISQEIIEKLLEIPDTFMLIQNSIIEVEKYIELED